MRKRKLRTKIIRSHTADIGCKTRRPIFDRPLIHRHMKLLRIAGFVAGLVAVLQNVSGQSFVNLDFEHPTIVTSSPSGYGFNSGLARIAGWTTYGSIVLFENGGDPTLVWLNSEALDSAAVDLESTNYFRPAIQGRYSVYLQGGTLAYQYAYHTTNGASIGQTGQIPLNAQSLTYWGGALQVSFDGQPLPFNAISNALNYTIWGVDISAFAGQTGQLLFSAPGLTWSMLDNIQFSSIPIPEPNTLSLISICVLFLCWRRKRPNSRIGCKAA